MSQKCKSCIATFGLSMLFVVYECPFPHKECEIKEKQHQEHNHSEIRTGPPDVKYAAFVSGSTIEIIQSPLIYEVKEDPNRAGCRIYKTIDL